MPDASAKPIIFLAFANDRDAPVAYMQNLPDEAKARQLWDALEP